VIAAALTAVFFGVTPAVARRSIRLLGFVRANFWRMAVALAVMGTLAFALGRGFGDQYTMLATAGAIGFGVGGIMMFRALPMLGAPLASLLVETTSAIAAAGLAWAWLDDAMSKKVILFCGVILAGVVVGLLPYIRTAQPKKTNVKLGVTIALISGLAQAVSLVITRKASMLITKAEAAKAVAAGGDPKAAPKAGTSLELVLSSAFDRLTGGLAVAVVILVVAWLLARRFAWAKAALRPAVMSPGAGGSGVDDLGKVGNALPNRAWFWVGANSLFGPILGVTCMVWALQTLQPGVAQSIVAVAPLIAIPFARLLEGYRPPPLYYMGAVIAVAGLVGLRLVQG
jgi:drug/metabolite transporter (DMT)-like permease